MLSRRRRLLSHATLGLAIGVLSWLFILNSSTGVTKLLLLGAAGASILVAMGFVVRFLAVLLSEPERSIPAEPIPSSRGTPLHWTERVLMAWAALCIAGLSAEAIACALEDPRRALGALVNLFIVGVLAMQAVRLLRAESRLPATSGAP